MTTKQGIYTLIFTAVSLLGPGDLLGQRSDFQSWWEFEFDRSVSSSLQLKGELEQRFKSNSLQFSRTLLTLGVEYDATKWLSLGGGARIIFVMDGEGQLHPRYRVHFNATGFYDLSVFTFSLRTRLQYGFEDVIYFGDLSLNSLISRNRLKVAQHIFGTKFGWFASLESWHYLSELPGTVFLNMRYVAGVRFDMNFKSQFNLRYIFEDEFNVTNPRQLHIVVAGYSHSF